MNHEKLFLADQRTEEVQHIIERMPTRFGFWVSMIVLFIFVLLFVFGWLIRYPDMVHGQIMINANAAPLKLIANSYGKLKLNGIKSMEFVKEGSAIAYIENSTNPTNVNYVDSLLKLYDPTTDDVLNFRQKLPQNFSLGELNIKYYSFVKSLQDYTNYKHDKILDKQATNLLLLLEEQKNAIATSEKRTTMAKNTLAYMHKFYARDSTLFLKKVISEAELDRTQMSYLNSKDALQSSINNYINYKQAAQQTKSRLQELRIQNPEKEKELRIALISAYNDLVDSMKNWKQKYVFYAPFDGKVQFLKFYNENQFVQSGEQVFTVVPKDEKAFGQVVLPAQGSGKIKVGQEVIVKLDNYPYMEYGSVTGRIQSISLTTSTTKTEKSEIDTYLVLVGFPSQLKTNYGATLDFKAEAKGTAEIITNDRKLMQRLFDNLKYIMNK